MIYNIPRFICVKNKNYYITIFVVGKTNDYMHIMYFEKIKIFDMNSLLSSLHPNKKKLFLYSH